MGIKSAGGATNGTQGRVREINRDEIKKGTEDDEDLYVHREFGSYSGHGEETMSANPFDIKTAVLARHAQHVVLIHFPIALFTAAVGFDYLAQWTKTVR